jgi:hypothetical protein
MLGIGVNIDELDSHSRKEEITFGFVTGPCHLGLGFESFPWAVRESKFH